MADMRMAASEVREQWSPVIKRVVEEGERVIVEKGGTAVAAIVSLQDLRRLEQLDRQRAEEEALLSRFRSALSHLSEAELLERVSREVADTRAQERARKHVSTTA